MTCGGWCGGGPGGGVGVTLDYQHLRVQVSPTAAPSRHRWRWRASRPSGLNATAARGRTGGRKPKLTAAKAATVRRMYGAIGPDGKRQHMIAEIAGAVGVHRTTVYDYLRKEG